MKTITYPLSVLLVAIVFVIGCNDTTNREVDQLFKQWDTQETPGAAVAIVKNGSILYKKGYGLANLEYNIPITPSTIFHIASVSKQFTVFAILLLEKEGKLSLDDDISTHIPEVPDFGKTITLRHLASHTSGMRDQWNLLALAGWRLDDVITKEHILSLVSRQQELNYNPGEEFLYCNTGFTLLAEVVARVSGQTFAEYTEQHIFDPLHMSNTLFYDDHQKIVANRAYSYYSDSTVHKKSVLSYANVGATSLFTTVKDLSRWAMNFSDITVGDKDIINTMNTPAVLNSGEKFGGALGQFVGKYKGLNQIQHSGGDAGYRSYLNRFPDQDFAVIVFSNDASFNPAKVAHQIVDIYLKEEIVEEPKEEEAPTAAASVDHEIIKAYLGDYELQPGFIISITEELGELYGQATSQPRFLLKPVSERKFEVEGVEAKIEFPTINDGEVQMFTLHQNGQIMEVRKLEPFDQSSVVLSEYMGRFYSEELETTFDLIVEDQQLIARHIRLGDIILSPSKRDVFVGDKWFFGQAEFIRDADQQITSYKVSAGRVRNVKFQKESG